MREMSTAALKTFFSSKKEKKRIHRKTTTHRFLFAIETSGVVLRGMMKRAKESDTTQVEEKTVVFSFAKGKKKQ